MEELTLTTAVIGVTLILTGQQRSPSTLLEQPFGQPFGMAELLDQSSLTQMLMVIIICTCSSQTFGQPFHHYQIITILFMQDRAPPHWSTIVRDWLNEKLPNRWIGRGADTDLNTKWPPRSPDLTPCDFFLWGYIKSKVVLRLL